MKVEGRCNNKKENGGYQRILCIFWGFWEMREEGRVLAVCAIGILFDGHFFFFLVFCFYTNSSSNEKSSVEKKKKVTLRIQLPALSPKKMNLKLTGLRQLGGDGTLPHLFHD